MYTVVCTFSVNFTVLSVSVFIHSSIQSATHSFCGYAVELRLTGHEIILGPFLLKVACPNQNLGSSQFFKLDPVTYFQAKGLAKLINVEPDKELVSTDCQTSMVFSK